MKSTKIKSFLKKIISPVLLLVFAFISTNLAIGLAIRDSYHPNADRFYFDVESLFWTGIVFAIGFIVNIILLFVKKSLRENVYTLWGFLIFISIVILFLGYLRVEPQPDYFTHSINEKHYQIPRYFTTSQNNRYDGVYLTIEGSIEENEPIYGVYQPKSPGKNSSSMITLRKKSNFSSFEFSYIMSNASYFSDDLYIKYINNKIILSNTLPDWLVVIENGSSKTITNITDEILTFSRDNPGEHHVYEDILNPYYYMKVDKTGSLLKFISCNNFSFQNYVFCNHYIFDEDTVLSFRTHRDRGDLPDNLSDLLDKWENEVKRVKDLVGSFEI